MLAFTPNYDTDKYENTCTDNFFDYEDSISHKNSKFIFDERAYKILGARVYFAFVTNSYHIYTGVSAEVKSSDFHHYSTQEMRLYSRYGYNTHVSDPRELIGQKFEIHASKGEDAGRICGNDGCDVQKSELEIISIDQGKVTFSWSGESLYKLYFFDTDNYTDKNIFFEALEVTAKLQWRSEIPKEFTDTIPKSKPKAKKEAKPKSNVFMFAGYTYQVYDAEMRIEQREDGLYLFSEVNADYKNDSGELDDEICDLRLYHEKVSVLV